MDISDGAEKSNNTKSRFWKKINEIAETNNERKTQLEGTWILNTVLTIILSHLSLIFLAGHNFYFQQDLKTTLIEYCLKGTLYISGLSLMSTTLLNKKNEEIPEKNKKKMKMIKNFLGIVLVIQAMFYSYSVDNIGIVSLNQFQVKISLLLYIVSIVLFSCFNYFNRKEIDYEDSQKAKREKLAKASRKKNSVGGLDI